MACRVLHRELTRTRSMGAVSSLETPPAAAPESSREEVASLGGSSAGRPVMRWRSVRVRVNLRCTTKGWSPLLPPPPLEAGLLGSAIAELRPPQDEEHWTGARVFLHTYTNMRFHTVRDVCLSWHLHLFFDGVRQASTVYVPCGSRWSHMEEVPASVSLYVHDRCQVAPPPRALAGDQIFGCYVTLAFSPQQSDTQTVRNVRSLSLSLSTKNSSAWQHRHCCAAAAGNGELRTARRTNHQVGTVRAGRQRWRPVLLVPLSRTLRIRMLDLAAHALAHACP